jgi:hypothetical protein
MAGAAPPPDALQLDQNPSPKDEARDFQNTDEKLIAANHAHEIAILNAKRGAIGKLTGSSNDAMNTGLLILIICLVLLALSMIGDCIKPEPFSSITDNLFKVVLTVAGYVFGTHNAAKP